MEEYQKFNDAINGFSPSFVRILLDRLKEIKKPDTTGVYRNHNATIKPFLGAVLYHLRSQVLGDNGPFCGQIHKLAAFRTHERDNYGYGRIFNAF